MRRFTLLLLLAVLTTTTAFCSDTILVEHFDTQQAFDKYKVIDSNEDGSTWKWNKDNQSAECLYSGKSQDSNDWLLTPELPFSDGRVYRVGYRVYATGIGYTEFFATAWGKGSDVSAYTNLQPKTLVDHVGGDFSNLVVCKADGNYRIGFHAVSSAAQFGINLDDIVIEDLASSAAPAAAGAVRGTAANDGTTTVTLTFRSPFRKADGSTLGSISKIEIYRNGALIQTIDTPETNRSLNYTDTGATNGENEYTIIAYNEAGAGIPATLSVYAGEDTPGSVSHVKLADEGNKIILSWDAPTKGADNGYFDASHCTYNIYYAGEYSAGDLYKSGVTGNAIAIDGNEGEQRVSGFYVSAVNNGGEGKKVASNNLLLGTPYQMPVLQDFGASFRNHWSWWNDNWTDDDNHLWWREEEGSSQVTYASTAGYMVYSGDGYSSSSFNSGKIDFKNVVNPKLLFSFQPSDRDDELLVTAVKPDNSTLQLITVSYEEQGNKKWETYSVDLNPLKGLDYAILKFTGNTEESYSIALDNIQIIDATEHNLNAKLYTPSRVMAGLESEAQVIVSNYGTQPASGYTVNLYANGEKVAETTTTTPLAPLSIDTTTLRFTARPGIDTLTVYAVVDYAEDQNTADNTTPAALVKVDQPDMERVTDLKATKAAGGNTLTWTAITPHKEVVTDDFESYPAFTLPGDGHYLEYEYNIGPWYNFDADQEYSLDLPGYTFPWEEEAYAFITFNPNQVATEDSTTAPFNSLSIFTPHSGEQYLTAFSMKGDMAIGNKVSDWLISPALTGDAQTISFWFKTLAKSNGTVSFQVAYSTTDSLHDSFTHVVADSVTTTTDWLQVNVELPAGAKYFAIHHITPIGINQALMIDDITYTQGTGEVLGYKVYRDGRYIATVESPEYTDAEGGEHDYNVTVVYNSGESNLSNTAVPATPTSISDVRSEVEGKTSSNTYNLAGQRIGGNYRGVVIRNGRKYVQK